MPKTSKSTKSVSTEPSIVPLSLRRGKVRFRFDDRPITGESVWVFAPISGNLHADVGLYGAPLAVLMGYQLINGEPNNIVRSMPDQKVMGRLLELTVQELHRLDSVAEHSGLQVHRFLTKVRSTHLGHEFEAWVFQLEANATAHEEALSAPSVASKSSLPLSV